MEYLGMDSLNDTPKDSVIRDADNTWTLTKVQSSKIYLWKHC